MSSFDVVVKLDVATMAATVIETLGIELGTQALGVSEARTVRQWIDGTRTVRGATAAQRLRTVTQIIDELSVALAPSQIQGWFTAGNPDLEFKSAMDLLNESR